MSRVTTGATFSATSAVPLPPALGIPVAIQEPVMAAATADISSSPNLGAAAGSGAFEGATGALASARGAALSLMFEKQKSRKLTPALGTFSERRQPGP